jgi:hypothetical protein
MIKRTLFYGFRVIVLTLTITVFLSCKRHDIYVVNAYEINNDWGYCILKNDKIIIKQTTIPTLAKSVRFKSKKDALKVGNLVLYRIKNRLSPTVTKNDLILLKIKR